MGDAIMTTPAVAAIRANFPHARISLLVVPWVAEVFRLNPHIDEIILYRRNDEHKGLKGKLALARELKEQRFDAAILLQNAFEAALLTWLARIPQRAGYNTDGRGLLLTDAVSMRREYKRAHETEYYLSMLRGLGLTTGDSALLLKVNRKSVQKAQTGLAALNGASGPLVIIAPGATYGSAKMWPAERYAELVRKFRQIMDARIVVLGGPKEKEIGDAILNGAGPKIELNLCGATELLEAAAWIEMADVFISNDSGLMHVAAALSRPQVAIFGSTDRVTTSPKNARARMVYKETSCSPCLKTVCSTDHRCMERVTVDDVYGVAVEIMEAKA